MALAARFPAQAPRCPLRTWPSPQCSAKSPTVSVPLIAPELREDLRGDRQPVGQAGRGWLAPDNVLNTRPIAQMRALLRRNRSASVADLGTAA
jgi:hypothetical protein